MGWEAVYCLLILILIIIGLLRNVSPDALLLGGVVLVAVAGIITPDEALAGFSNAGVLTVGALYVVAAALRETAALDLAGLWVLGGAKTERSALLRMSALLPGMSAFLNNTPIVAISIPIVSGWCKKHHVAPSRLLLPLSYLSLLGGTCTLIGTSTNLVVNGLMTESWEASSRSEAGFEPMGFFELGQVGIVFAVVGVGYLLLIGRHLLPSRKDLMEKFKSSAREYLVNMEVRPGCRLCGHSVEEAGLRHLPGLYLIEITRGGQLISPVPPDFILEEGDILTFTGVVETIVDLERIPGLEPIAEDKYEVDKPAIKGGVICEAVVSPTCPSIGKTIREGDFRATYNAAVIAVHRGGQKLGGKVGDIVLRGGDTLLLRAGAHFRRANRNNPHFLLVGGVDWRTARHDKSIWAWLLLLALVVLLISGVLSIVISAFLIAGLMIIFRCVSIADARRSVDWRTLIAIASAFGLGKALYNSGLVDYAAQFFGEIGADSGPLAALGGVYILTIVLAAIVTNNAAAALAFPFAVGMASQVNANPRPFIMAVAFAASASFISPVAYQTNLMVYGPGGYRFRDFVLVGLPLNVVLFVLSMLLIPVVWPI